MTIPEDLQPKDLIKIDIDVQAWAELIKKVLQNPAKYKVDPDHVSNNDIIGNDLAATGDFWAIRMEKSYPKAESMTLQPLSIYFRLANSKGKNYSIGTTPMTETEANFRLVTIELIKKTSIINKLGYRKNKSKRIIQFCFKVSKWE